MVQKCDRFIKTGTKGRRELRAAILRGGRK
nr:MAG TPA_asm: hypothetical protein [Caudoviricetes sp.]